MVPAAGAYLMISIIDRRRVCPQWRLPYYSPQLVVFILRKGLVELLENDKAAAPLTCICRGLGSGHTHAKDDR